MRSTKYLLIGGGMASHRAVGAIRQHDSSGQIFLVGAEKYLPYERPPLTKSFMQGKAPIQKVYPAPEQYYRDAGVELLLGTPVTHLDATRHMVRLADGQEVGFEKALLATGGRPVRLHVLGQHLRGVHYFRTIDDAQALSSAVKPGRKVAIVGGGFIGVELAASLTGRGADVTLIHGGEHLWSRFAGPQTGQFLHDYLAARGVGVLTRRKLGEIQGDKQVHSVLTSEGVTVGADVVCIAAGISPAVELARGAGLSLADGVVVDEHCRTSHHDVYAAGDLANFPDPHLDTRRRVEHWGQADYMGALAGRNMTGQQEPYDLLTYVFSDVFDLHVEASGDLLLGDRTVVRGEMDSGRFTVLGLKGERLMGYVGFNSDKDEREQLGQLIKDKTDANAVMQRA